MKFLFSALMVAITAFLVLSCADNIVNYSNRQRIEPYDTLVLSDPDDAAITPDFKSMTFYLYDSSITVAVDLWERYDSADYPTDYMFFVYLYGNFRDVITFERRRFTINRDNGADGHFEELLAEGVVTWPDSKTVRIEYDKAIMPDFEVKDVWMTSMGSRDRAPDSGRLHIADSLPQN